MNEDQQRNRSDNGPNNLAVLRHMALNVMQKDPIMGRKLPQDLARAVLTFRSAIALFGGPARDRPSVLIGAPVPGSLV